MLRVSGRLSGQSQSQSNHWQKIIESLDKLLKILQDNHVCVSLFPYHSLVLICWMCVYCCFVYPQVPPVLAQKIFTQIFSYINVQLFNRCAYLSVSWLLCLWKLVWPMVCGFALQSIASSWVLLLQQWRVCQGWSSWVGVVVCKGNNWGDLLSVYMACFILFYWLITEVLWLQYAASSWDELKHIRQAVGFLVWPVLPNYAF